MFFSAECFVVVLQLITSNFNRLYDYYICEICAEECTPPYSELNSEKQS